MDAYKIIFDLAILLSEHNTNLFLLMRNSLNKLLVNVRDNLTVCDYSPSIAVILKD